MCLHLVIYFDNLLYILTILSIRVAHITLPESWAQGADDNDDDREDLQWARPISQRDKG